MELTGNIKDTPLQEILQVLAYSQRSGVLSVKGHTTVGSVLFERGGIICTHTDSTRTLLDKIAAEVDPHHRSSLRRVQALASMAELFDLDDGLFCFSRLSEPLPALEGVDMGPFYADGGMDTGDLLLLLTKAMDPGRQKPPPPALLEDEHSDKRRYPRFGPMMIPAELNRDGAVLKGFLTNLSLGGSFFHAEDLPLVDHTYELEFKLPRDLGRCQAYAKVVWVRVHVMDASRGVGLQFESMPTDSTNRLANYLKQFMKLAADMEGQNT